MSKIISTVRNHWKKTIFFSGCAAYATKFFYKWHRENLLMEEYCFKAREYGRQTITPNERPRKVIVFLNPAAKDGKTKYLLEKHVLPLLHLAGIELHVVRTEHEGQAKAYMSVLDNNIVDAIIVAGGDGTLSEIVTGLLRRDDGIAERMPIGVLPFGNTNSFASRVFPVGELEVERFCQATMAVIQNRFAMADVMEVEPLPSESSEAAENSAPAQSSIEENGTEAKKVYLMSHIKWGVHSEVERVKWKYWYMVGPLKTWYCYLKTILFNEWPPNVRAEAEITPPCDGCNRCVAKPTVTRVQPVKPVTKSSWWWPVDNRTKTTTIPTDPRSQVDNPQCGMKTKQNIDTHQLELISVKQNNQSGGSCSQLELYTSPDPSKRDLLFKQSNTASERHCTPLSSITIYPKHTQYQWFMMDSEKYELMPARVTLLKDKIKIFMPAIS